MAPFLTVILSDAWFLNEKNRDILFSIASHTLTYKVIIADIFWGMW
jgi:hypothetical protein